MKPQKKKPPLVITHIRQDRYGQTVGECNGRPVGFTYAVPDGWFWKDGGGYLTLPFRLETPTERQDREAREWEAERNRRYADAFANRAERRGRIE